MIRWKFRRFWKLLSFCYEIYIFGSYRPILFVLQEKIVTMQILQKLAGKVNRKFDRKLTGNWPEINRKFDRKLSANANLGGFSLKLKQKCLIFDEIGQKLTGNWPEIDRKLTGNWPEIEWKLTRNWPKIDRKLTGIEDRSENATHRGKMPRNIFFCAFGTNLGKY